MEEQVYYYFYVDIPDVNLFSSRYYINVVEEGPAEGIFYTAEAPSCERAVMQPIHGTEAENQIGGRYE